MVHLCFPRQPSVFPRRFHCTHNLAQACVEERKCKNYWTGRGVNVTVATSTWAGSTSSSVPSRARCMTALVSLSAMGQLAANRSSFDVRNYGFKRLSDLVRTAGDNFKLERREGRLYVKRLR